MEEDNLLLTTLLKCAICCLKIVAPGPVDIPYEWVDDEEMDIWNLFVDLLNEVEDE